MLGLAWIEIVFPLSYVVFYVFVFVRTYMSALLLQEISLSPVATAVGPVVSYMLQINNIMVL